MIVKTDKNKLVNIETIKRTDCYYCYAFNLEGEKMGYASFVKQKDDEVWLYQVATYEDFRNQGIGSVLLDFVAYWTTELNCNNIAGKFKPTSPYAAEFYHKNGFDIVEKEYYFRLEKSLKKEQIIQNTKSKYKTLPTISEPKQIAVKNYVEKSIIPPKPLTPTK